LVGGVRIKKQIWGEGQGSGGGPSHQNSVRAQATQFGLITKMCAEGGKLSVRENLT